MRFDIETLTPRPSLWFSEHIEYRGIGRAELECPKGTFEGPTVTAIDRFGRSTVTMNVETVETEASLVVGPVQLLLRDQPTRGSPWSLGGEENPCTRLEASCPEGKFIGAGRIIRTGIKWQLEGGVEEITFVPLRSQFNVASAGVSKYWALPLSNFLSEFFDRSPRLNRHPLRMYPTPEIPRELTENDRFFAETKANEKNRLIIFEFKGALGFIEAMPDYEERKSRLQEGQGKCLITAVMVGEAPSDLLDWNDLERWFPFKLLDILSFATGSEVGAPWIEFRDDRGGLVRRFHASMGGLSYARGHRVIREDIHRGTGLLLTHSLSSPEFGKSYLHIAIKHTVRGGTHEGAYLEDRFNHVARALDSIAKDLRLDHVELLEALRPSLAEAVKQALRAATEKIRAAAQSAASADSHDEEKVLERIARRIESNITSAWDFGQAVTRLLDHFGFSDAQIAEKYYGHTPRLSRTTWAKTLSQCRATVMHGSFFDFQKDGLGVQDVVAILNHLHDVLARMILQTLRYDGSYQPTVMKSTTDTPTNWVKSETSAKNLGYE